MKLVVNMVMGTMMASFAEGLILAENAGLSKEDLIEVSLEPCLTTHHEICFAVLFDWQDCDWLTAISFVAEMQNDIATIARALNLKCLAGSSALPVV